MTKKICKNCKNCKKLNNIIENLEDTISNLENTIESLENRIKNNNVIKDEKKNSISIIDYIKYLHLKEVHNTEELEIIKYNITKKERLNKDNI
tara:strand:+ start:234 stop:512 length:279 start_codon:yes stop_codon:yes gene_type:complete